MLRSRVIPCLLIHRKGLVKTVKFASHKYVGDPVNAVKIFNEKEVDELMVLDIDATVENRPPDFTVVRNMAVECRMPFCYGGGVKSVEQARHLIHLGAEKVAFSSAAIENPALLQDTGQTIGVQSVVVVLDYKKPPLFGDPEVFTHNGTKATGRKLYQIIEQLNRLGVGEIVINSIDRDGTMEGYDLKTAEKARAVSDVPLTILGGAGKAEDIVHLVQHFGVIGAAAGSLFVFKGKYRAVLINYLSPEDRERTRS